ncbi:hypothetical protein NW752_001252 [Fusarium irregulare]|uniref:F-box domain-containing protein n=1 Tax=Fusarium irregulare TaxID=2494466 RepID=A0A9W8PGL7_9HYPO|nr:hypothetical protein NW766_010832 [Fusarium irregulare]KAJ4026313.1 hypothetical protein NW752_001252 [Fusarium irregulare]
MPSLVTIPTEMIAEIAESLRPQDLKALSLTSRQLRHAISHILFRTINIACPLVSDMLLDHMLTKYGHVISRIHLHIRLRPNLPVDEINGDETIGDNITQMPSIWGTHRNDTLLKLVRGKIFSHINSFSVRFDPSQFDRKGWFGDGGTWGGGEGIFAFRDVEDDEDWEGDAGANGNGMMLNFERMYIWRAQYNQVFEALVTNPNITKLRFVDLLPRKASIWYSDEWDSMLRRLTHFDVSIFGAKTAHRPSNAAWYGSVVWHGNATWGFIFFISEFQTFIGQFLTNVKHLRLEASPVSVFGTDITFQDGGTDTFPLYAPTPALQSLELKNIVLGIDVLFYLQKESGTLRELTLHNCMCLITEEGEDPGWTDILDEVSGFKMLRRLNVLQDETPPLGNPLYSRLSRRARREVKRIKELAWRYVYIDFRWGTVHEDDEQNVQELHSYHAYWKYRDLQETLKERRKNSVDE